jgi:hypothetical protein
MTFLFGLVGMTTFAVLHAKEEEEHKAKEFHEAGEDGVATHWGPHVTDEEYLADPTDGGGGAP